MTLDEYVLAVTYHKSKRMLTGSKEVRVTQCPQSRYPAWRTNKALRFRNRFRKTMGNSLRKYGLLPLSRP
jgi:hypothetical protein